jgi:preprotein translocase subunit SecG
MSTTVLTIIHVLACLVLIGIVLLQQGKGSDMGAAFGGGSSQTVFGADGPMPLLSKVTTGCAVVFMLTCLALAYMSSHNSSNSVMNQIVVPKTEDKVIEKTLQPTKDLTTEAEETAPAPAEETTE